MWKNLVVCINKLKINGLGINNMISGVVGSGTDIRFWIDPWICNEALKDRFPCLFQLEKYKGCKVVERCIQAVDGTVLVWCYTKAPESNDELKERAALELLINGLVYGRGEQKWQWNDKNNKVFTVATAKEWLTGSSPVSDHFDFQWCKWIPGKCNIFMWRAFLDRLPTKIELVKRNVFTEDCLCALCEEGEETVDHIFTGCVFAARVWNGTSLWCGIPNIFAFSTKDLVNLHKHI